MKNLASLIFCFSFLFIACSKDEPTVKVSLTSKIWKPSSVDKNPLSSPNGQNIFSARQDCEKDDTYKFDTDGKLIINRGTLKCDNAEIATEVTNYTYNQSTKELTIKGVKYIIADESVQLKYYASVPSTTGISYIIFLFE